MVSSSSHEASLNGSVQAAAAAAAAGGTGSREAPRQGVVVHTEHGSERHLHVNGTTFRVRLSMCTAEAAGV